MRPRSVSPGTEKIVDFRRKTFASRRKLRIALIAHLKYPIAQPYCGGLEMHTHLVARKLISRGHHVTMFASHGSDPSTNLVSVCDPTGNLSGDCETRRECEAYDEIVNRIATGDFDIVHNNSLHPAPLASSGRLPPMMTVLHTPPLSSLADQARIARGMHFVAVSRAVVDQWQGYVSDIDIIPNGIELDMFVPDDHAAARPPHAIWYGRIVPEKGLHLAIEAARHASLPIDFAGPIIDRHYWSKCVAPLCGDTARYLGHFDHATLRRHIAQADVALISPRWEEPFGLVAAEAIACGTPVAAFRRGALPDVVGRAGVLAEPDNAIDLARAAREALEISSSLCRRWAEDTLDCAVMISRYESIYNSICAISPVISAAAD